MVDKVQPSFAAGEITPALWGRVDLERWQSALRRCEHMLVMPFGGVVGRPGLGYTHKTKYPDQAVVLVRFIYSREQAYIIEFGPNYALFTANDARVTDGSTVAVASVVVGTGYFLIETDDPHGLVVGDVVTASGIKGTGSIPGANDSHTVSEVPSTTTFKVPRITSGSGVYSSGGAIERCVQLVTPYAAGDLADLRFTQSADVLTVFHQNHKTREISRTAVNAFSIEAPVYEDGPFLDENTDEDITVYSSAETGTVTLIASDNIFLDGHVGALFRMKEKNLQRTRPWEPTKLFGGNPFGLQRRSDGKTYECVTNTGSSCATGTVAPTHERGTVADGDGNKVDGLAVVVGVKWQYLHSGFGIVRIESVVSGTEATATVLRRLPRSVVGGAVIDAGPWTMTGTGSDFTLSVTGATSDEPDDYEVRVADALLSPGQYSVNSTSDVLTFVDAPANAVAVSAFQGNSDNLTDLWAFGAWSDVQGYPSVGTYYGDRLVAAGTAQESQRVDMSEVGIYKKFGVSVPLEDDDAISFTVNSREVNPIKDLVPLEQLVILTDVSALRVGAGSDDAITPSTVGVRPQSFRGSNGVPARMIGDGAVHPQRNGTRLRELSYQYEGAKFSGEELSLLARHLFGGSRRIVDMDYADEPDNVLWVIVSSGALYGLTYIKEQQVVGWHRHPLSGRAERLCVIPDGERDVLYVVVRRTVAGGSQRYVEKLTSTDYDDRRDAVCVDCSLTYDGRGDGVQSLTLNAIAWTAGEAGIIELQPGAASFTADDVGDEVWLYDEDGNVAYRGVIARLLSSLSVEVGHSADVPSWARGVALTAWGIARSEFAGLDHLAGREVAVCADAEDGGTYTVAEDGRVTTDTPGVVVHVGLAYIPLIETLDMDFAFLDRKRVTELGVMVQDTTYFEASGSDGGFTGMRTRSDDDSYDPSAPTTGLVEMEMTTGFTEGGRITIRQTKPVPIRVLSLIAKITKGD